MDIVNFVFLRFIYTYYSFRRCKVPSFQEHRVISFIFTSYFFYYIIISIIFLAGKHKKFKCHIGKVYLSFFVKLFLFDKSQKLLIAQSQSTDVVESQSMDKQRCAYVYVRMYEYENNSRGAGSLPMRIAEEDRRQEDVRGQSARRRRKWTFAHRQPFWRRISPGVPHRSLTRIEFKKKESTKSKISWLKKSNSKIYGF